MGKPMLIPTSTHWGNFDVETRNARVVAIHPAEHDTQPSPIGQFLLASQDAGCRVPRPCIRAGYLKRPGRSDGTHRGVEPFVAVPWDEALDMAAEALRRVVAEQGNEAIFGGSYGWASAGRFHHSSAYAERIPQRLVLIDGDELTRLMVQYGVGVRTDRTIELRKLDLDLFEDEAGVE